MPDPRAEADRLTRIDAAFAAGDMAALRAAVDDPPGFPNNLAAIVSLLQDNS